MISNDNQWTTVMSQAQSIWVDFRLLRNNPHFRAIFIARLVSVLGLGMLTVAVPVQIHVLTGSTLQVGIATALDGLGMFIGLLAGGVLADRYDRRLLILLARGLCGLGFLLLALNSFIAQPSLVALYVVAFWDGFFGALGMTALMAAIPGLVGRDNLAAAGALSMLIVRLGAVLAPTIGGLVIVSLGVSWNYLLAGLGTLCTLVPLLRLPRLLPLVDTGDQQPWQALLEGVRFLLQHPIVGAVVALGTVQALLSAIRVLFPALAEQGYAAAALAVGLMFSAVPLGAMLGALTSGWVGTVRYPGQVLWLCVISAALLVASLGWVSWLPLALVVLATLGYLSSIASLLQFTLVQSHTPDAMLGRINSLWSAQDVVGDSLGALGLGAVARALGPLLGVTGFGLAAAALAGILGSWFVSLRQLSQLQPSLTEPALESESAT